MTKKKGSVLGKYCPAIAQMGERSPVVSAPAPAVVSAPAPAVVPVPAPAVPVPAPEIKTYQGGLEEGRKYGFEKGIEKGKKEGYAAGVADGITQGRTAGKKEGYEKGKTDGFTQGYNEGGLFISHKYVETIESKLAEHDGYNNIILWRHEGKIPAWWIAAMMKLYKPLGELLKVKPPEAKPEHSKEAEPLGG